MIAHHYKELKNFLMSLRDYIDLERGGENINRVNIQVFWPKNKKNPLNLC